MDDFSRAIKLARGLPDALPRMRASRGKDLSTMSTPPVYTREKIYRTERRAQRALRPEARYFQSIDEAREYLTATAGRYSSRYARLAWPFRVEESDNRSSTYDTGVFSIWLPSQQLVLLHELAHHAVGQEAGHGPDFTTAYHYLVRQEMGDRVAAMLGADTASSNDQG